VVLIAIILSTSQIKRERKQQNWFIRKKSIANSDEQAGKKLEEKLEKTSEQKVSGMKRE